MIRVRRRAATFAAGTLCLSVAACVPGASTATTGKTPGAAATAPADVGKALFAAAPPVPVEAGATQPDPIVIPNAVVQSDVRVQIPAQVDGLIELIAVPLKAGEKADPNDPNIVYHARDVRKETPFRRLRENDVVKAGEVMGRLDDQLVLLQIEQSKNMIDATKKAITAAKQAEDKQQEMLNALYKVPNSRSEVLNQESLLARYVENRLQSEKELAKLVGEERTAQAQSARYWVLCPINGRVVKTLKVQQEFAKAGEVLLEIQATDRVRVEGKLPVEYARYVRRGMKVSVEPARPVGPNAVSITHRQEVTGVAVTAHPGRPMIVSGGLDGIVNLWDVMGTQQAHPLKHPDGVGVRSVACTGKDAKQHLVATGGDDGKVRIWDVTNPDKLPKEPVTLDDSHGTAVAAVAFSPDGKYLATAAGRDVIVWDVAGKKKLYAVPPEHRDAVTTVRFTPQCTLVTAARDRSIRVWELGEKGAKAKSAIDHRGGGVDVLGVSSDGSKVLFDKDPSRLDVVSLADERTVGTIQNPGGGPRFGTFALFSEKDKLVLTAGGDADQKGEVTLWSAPQVGGRGSEQLRMMVPKGAAATCAAFSPDAEKPFVAVGTADGGVYFWTPAALAERGRPMTGEVVAVLPADSRSVTVRVEMANPNDAWGEGLQDRSQATIIVPPEGTAPVPPAPPLGALDLPPAAPATDVRPAGGLVVAGGVPPAPVVPASGVVPVSAVVPAATAVPPPVAPPAAAPPAGPASGPSLVRPSVGGIPFPPAR